MFKNAILITYYCETPLHMGSGQSISYVDLPIQREKHTNFPTIWSSSIKGVVREKALRSGWNKEKLTYIFGSEAEESSDNLVASCISFTDAKILFYPVRSAKGIFAWITCPFVLKRFVQEVKSVGSVSISFEAINKLSKSISLIEQNGFDNNVVLFDSNAYIKNASGKVMLEEFEFSAEEKSDDINQIINLFKSILPENELTKEIEKRLAIVSDDIFSALVNYAVEVRTRIRINQLTGTVEEKALFTEELLPSETIFYGFIFTTDPFFGIDSDTYKLLISSPINWREVEKCVSDKEKLKILKEAAGEENENISDNEDRYLTSEDVVNQLIKLLDNNLLQLGADSTLGRGFIKTKTTLKLSITS